jgi:hypothetical protein
VTEPVHLIPAPAFEATPMMGFDDDDPDGKIETAPTEVQIVSEGPRQRAAAAEHSVATTTDGATKDKDQEIFFVCVSPVLGIFANERTTCEKLLRSTQIQSGQSKTRALGS